MSATFDLQPILENERVKLVPLKESDFEKIFMVASDPLMWLQHPNKNRYKKTEFLKFFEGAIASQGAFGIYNKEENEWIGCTRFYDYDSANNSILIGYTFFALHCWGKGFNSAVKKLMMDYAFQYVDKIHFHVGAKNKRSQLAIEKLGAVKIKEIEVAYYGEDNNLNFVYEIKKIDYLAI